MRGLILFLCLSVSLPLQAQGIWSKLMRSEVKTAEGQIHSVPDLSGQLSARAARTYEQAVLQQQLVPKAMLPTIGDPVLKLRHNQYLSSQNLYPEVPFLKTSKQTSNYFIARNNRLFLQEQRRMEAFTPKLYKRLPDMQRIADDLEQPEEVVTWLTDYIPYDTLDLFIGEVHGYPEIQWTISQLFPALRKKFMQRKILLFTEFLPEGYVYDASTASKEVADYLQHYFPVWQLAKDQQIQTIGLEPKHVIDDECTVRYRSPKGKMRENSIWTTIEGVRLRNERWNKILQAYRGRYPDALFIIYTGADHSFYNRPFALTQGHVKENTFMAAFYPEQTLKFVPSGTISALAVNQRTGPLENLTEDIDFPQKVLYWNEPELSELSGFDVRVKVPVHLEY